MKKLLFFFLIVSHVGFAQSFSDGFRCSHAALGAMAPENINFNDRSDSIDVLNYSIYVDVTDFVNKQITARCVVHIQAKQAISALPLDLLVLTVDSVKFQGNTLNFTHNDTFLTIPLSMNNQDTGSIEVFYHGSPVKDASGWGGWYWSGDYAWNLGVGFAADPHNYGRIWHPCFDSFKEKATYDFYITTESPKVATANGVLMNETQNGNFITRHWQLTDPIPTYLAALAVAPYQTVHMTYSGNQTIPIELYAKAGDTTNMKASFVHLENAIQSFENGYGPHAFQKIGYSMVPFNSGAMEHATNIAYPISSANGTTNSEKLMAHELAHHWWGDKVTCETAEDMWLNEGWASFSEALFLEEVYGKSSYTEEIQSTLLKVISKAHIQEGGYLAVSGVNHTNTYGTHVYDKGALVAHNLRTYLGDALFFSGVSQFLDQRAYGTMNSTQFRDELEQITGEDLGDFFEDWVFNGGFPDFRFSKVDTIVTSNPEYRLEFTIEANSVGAPSTFENVPLRIAFFDETGNPFYTNITYSSMDTAFSANIPFLPSCAQINSETEVAYANTFDRFWVTPNSNFSNLSGNSKMVVQTGNFSDSAMLIIEHHWVGPKGAVDETAQRYQLSDDHYWSIHGIIPNDFDAEAVVLFNTTSSNSYLDSGLVSTGIDSLVLLYRQNAEDLWREYDDYNLMVGPTTIRNLKKGDYCFANKGDLVSSIQEAREQVQGCIKVYPNPSSQRISFEACKAIKQIEVYDTNKRLKYTHRVNSNEVSHSVDISNWPKGTYFYAVTLKRKKETFSGKLIVQ